MGKRPRMALTTASGTHRIPVTTIPSARRRTGHRSSKRPAFTWWSSRAASNEWSTRRRALWDEPSELVPRNRSFGYIAYKASPRKAPKPRVLLRPLPRASLPGRDGKWWISAARWTRRTYVRYGARVTVTELPGPLPGPLPRRDPAARARLADTAARTRPAVLAGERLLAVPGALGELLPGGGIPRGTVVALTGGAGVTSTGLLFAAAATTAGEWVVAVDDDTFGGLAALEAGIAPDRFALVRRVPPARWATVVAALLDGVGVVLAAPPRALRHGDARRLVARARERDAVLIVLGTWPVEAALCLTVEGTEWSGPGADGSGWLEGDARTVRVDGRAAHGMTVVAG